MKSLPRGNLNILSDIFPYLFVDVEGQRTSQTITYGFKVFN